MSAAVWGARGSRGWPGRPWFGTAHACRAALALPVVDTAIKVLSGSGAASRAPNAVKSLPRGIGAIQDAAKCTVTQSPTIPTLPSVPPALLELHNTVDMSASMPSCLQGAGPSATHSVRQTPHQVWVSGSAGPGAARAHFRWAAATPASSSGAGAAARSSRSGSMGAAALGSGRSDPEVEQLRRMLLLSEQYGAMLDRTIKLGMQLADAKATLAAPDLADAKGELARELADAKRELVDTKRELADARAEIVRLRVALANITRGS